jgi:hypothetical protein
VQKCYSDSSTTVERQQKNCMLLSLRNTTQVHLTACFAREWIRGACSIRARQYTYFNAMENDSKSKR